ncbi:MAG: SusD/RagB family nutrient-binding outer membrane lipoprotein [Cyclobacteriaceae bacterium]
MKKMVYKLKSLVLLFVLISFSCTDDLTEINKDPNSFNVAEPENLLAHSVKQTLDLVGGDMNFQMFLNYSHYVGGVGGQFPRFFFTESALDDWWRRMNIGILKNTQEIIDNFSDNDDYSNRVLIAKVWKSYVYSIMVSTFGPVPMKSALGTATEVPYDSEEAVYTEILTLLKEAGDNIDVAGDKLSQDAVFAGDNTKWIKFANSLRLKIALRISGAFPTLSETHVREVMSDESMLISNNGDNATISWGQDEENWSYPYRRFVTVADAAQFPKMNHTFMLYMKTYQDPRVTVFSDPASQPRLFLDSLYESEGSTNKVAVVYPVPYIGTPLGFAPLAAWDLNGNDNPLQSTQDENFATPKLENFMAADIDYPISTIAEVNFLKAEAALKGWGGTSTPEQYYYAGIDASFDQYSVGGSAAYKERDGVKWGTSSTGDRNVHGIVTSGISASPLEKIVVQRWLSGFFQGHDIWCLQRRTRLLNWDPHLSPDSGEGDYQHIPERMIYPTSEAALNGTAYEVAVGMLGGIDYLYTPLKINKSYTPVVWENFPAEYNTDFYSQYYGDSVDDLIAAGVTYEIQE